MGQVDYDKMEKEELIEALEDVTNRFSNSQTNQHHLEKENIQLRQMLTESQSGKTIYGKMLAIKKDLDAIGKDQKNTGQGWSFRGIDDFMNALKPITDKHGVFVVPKVRHYPEAKFVETKNDKTGTVKRSKNTQVIMEYAFYASDGSSVEVWMPAEGVDPGDKGTNKSLSAAFKYALMQTFIVATKDMEEGDKQNPRVDGGGEKTTKKPDSKKTEKKTKTPDKPKLVKDEPGKNESKTQSSFRREKVKSKSTGTEDDY